MIKFDNAPTLYTIEEATEMIQLSYQTIRHYLASGKLRGRKVGNKWYVFEESLKELAIGSVDASSVVSSGKGEEVKA